MGISLRPPRKQKHFPRLQENISFRKSMAALNLALSAATFLLLCLTPQGSSGVETMANLDLKEFLLQGRQQDRADLLHFTNVCRCQCRNLTVFDDRFNGYKGNCLTKDQGFRWCYVSDEAARNCYHVREGKYANSKWSFDACYTPAAGEGPCTEEYKDKYYDDGDNDPLLTMCALRKGTYNDGLDDTENIIKACYFKQNDFPDQGCHDPVETIWGPAKPCRCYDVQFKQGVSKVRRDSYWYCQRDAGQANGGAIVDTSGTAGIGSVKVRGSYKARRRCEWKIVPRRGGRWRCVPKRRRGNG